MVTPGPVRPSMPILQEEKAKLVEDTEQQEQEKVKEQEQEKEDPNDNLTVN